LVARENKNFKALTINFTYKPNCDRLNTSAIYQGEDGKNASENRSIKHA